MRTIRLSKRQQSLAAEVYGGDNPYILAVGASGSGKTTAALCGFLSYSLKHSNKTFGLVAKTKLLSREVIGTACMKLIPYATHFAGGFTWHGNRFLYLDGNNITARERIQGLDLAGVYVDEVVNLDYNVFLEIDQRVRSVPDGRIVMTANPKSEYHWFKKEYVDRQNDIGLSEFHFLQSDNPGLPASEKTRMQKTAKHDRSLYARRILGQWANPVGAVYPFVSVREHDPAEVLSWHIAVDPADSSTTHALLIGSRPGKDGLKWHIFDELVLDSRSQGRKSHAEQARMIGNRWDASIATAVVDSAAQSFKDELAKVLNVPVYDSDKKSKIDGINATGYALSNEYLTISEKCRHLLSEIKVYHWDERKMEQGETMPVKIRDHGCDAMRYFVTTLMVSGSQRGFSIEFSERK